MEPSQHRLSDSAEQSLRQNTEAKRTNLGPMCRLRKPSRYRRSGNEPHSPSPELDRLQTGYSWA